MQFNSISKSILAHNMSKYEYETDIIPLASHWSYTSFAQARWCTF